MSRSEGVRFQDHGSETGGDRGLLRGVVPVIEPLRSMTNKMFAGSNSDCTELLKHAESRMPDLGI
jgi:hypothetical protein